MNDSTKTDAEPKLPNIRGRNESLQLHAYFVFFVAACCVGFWIPLKDLIAFSLTHDYGSHIVLIAPLSILLVYLKRDEVFSDLRARKNLKTVIAASGLFLVALFLLPVSQYEPLNPDKLSLEILSLVILWWSVFAFCYGTGSFMRALFPLLFLLLLVPFPEFVLDRIVFALQVGSSDVAYGLLRLLNVPVLKEGFILQLPLVNLEVAKECSGIRSSIALLVTMLVAAELALRSSWRKAILVLAIIPMLVFKNGLRIVTIYLLAAYLNPAFLHGWLHTSGGVVFYLIGLLALVPVAVLLRRWERKGSLSPVHRVAHVTSA